jgi:hypothetical protein
VEHGSPKVVDSSPVGWFIQALHFTHPGESQIGFPPHGESQEDRGEPQPTFLQLAAAGTSLRPPRDQARTVGVRPVRCLAPHAAVAARSAPRLPGGGAPGAEPSRRTTRSPRRRRSAGSRRGCRDRGATPPSARFRSPFRRAPVRRRRGTHPRRPHAHVSARGSRAGGARPGHPPHRCAEARSDRARPR